MYLYVTLLDPCRRRVDKFFENSHRCFYAVSLVYFFPPGVVDRPYTYNVIKYISPDFSSASIEKKKRNDAYTRQIFFYYIMTARWIIFYRPLYAAVALTA